MKASMPKELDISEEEDSLPSGLDDGGSIVSLEDFEESEDDTEEPSQVGEEDDDDTKLSLVESSDAEDLIPFDEAEEIAFKGGLMDLVARGGGSDSQGEDEEWTGFGDRSPVLGEKRKLNSGKEPKKRKMARSLPTFANYDDYAQLIEEGPEDDI